MGGGVFMTTSDLAGRDTGDHAHRKKGNRQTIDEKKKGGGGTRRGCLEWDVRFRGGSTRVSGGNVEVVRTQVLDRSTPHKKKVSLGKGDLVYKLTTWDSTYSVVVKGARKGWKKVETLLERCLGRR